MQQVLEQVMGDGGWVLADLPWLSLPPTFTYSFLLLTYNPTDKWKKSFVGGGISEWGKAGKESPFPWKRGY